MSTACTILGIESSCDETAAAIVSSDRTVHANIIASSAELHARYGGVVPEIAARQHLDVIRPVIEQTLSEAGCSFDDIDGIAATSGELPSGSASVSFILFSQAHIPTPSPRADIDIGQNNSGKGLKSSRIRPLAGRLRIPTTTGQMP